MCVAAPPVNCLFLEGKEAQTSRKMLAYRGHGWKKQLGRCPVNHVETS